MINNPKEGLKDILNFLYYMLHVCSNDDQEETIFAQLANMSWNTVKGKLFRRFQYFIQDMKTYVSSIIGNLNLKQLVKTFDMWRVLSESLSLERISNYSLAASEIWVIIDELIDIMLLLAESRFGYRLNQKLDEEMIPKKVKLPSPKKDHEEAKRLEMEKYKETMERLRITQEEKRRIEEDEMWRHKKLRARSMIIHKLREGYPTITSSHWTALNSFTNPPEGVHLICSWLYY